MALMLRSDAGASAPDAVVLAEGLAELPDLGARLDREFGKRKWRAVPHDAAPERLAEVAGAGAIALVPLASDAPDRLARADDFVRGAQQAGLAVLVVAGEISARTMHRFMNQGVAGFAPFPEPASALSEAIEKLRFERAGGRGTVATGPGGGAPARLGRVTAVYGLAGGVGTSTVAANLAWELAGLVRRDGRRVILLDLNFQYGSIATLLDVPRREAVYELVTDARNFDQTGLVQALSVFRERLHVLTAPRDSLPLDAVSSADVEWIVGLAREGFDHVIIDMPQTLMAWSEPIYAAADRFLCLMETDMRSAQNAFRFLRTLKAENMPLDKLRFVVNRAPRMTDLSGKARVRRLSTTLGVQFSAMLPDGGRAVTAAGDEGVPLAEAARTNPTRREIARLAELVAGAEAEADRDR